jgi:hypothetical protein
VNLGWCFIHVGGILRPGSLYWEKNHETKLLTNLVLKEEIEKRKPN